MIIEEMIRTGSGELKDAGIDNFAGEAKDILMFITGYDASRLFMHGRDEAPRELENAYNKIIEKRCTHYPLQYIFGYTYFMGYKFLCREKVLIPRFDTENLISSALEDTKERDSLEIIDMCTGTGCIGISFYLERLKSGHKDRLTLVDISDDAIQLSRDNLALFKEIEPGQVAVVKSDLFKELKGQRFDVLLSNPPYIPTEVCDTLEADVRDYEPRLALDGDIDGLSFYKRIISGMCSHLNDGAYISMEIGFDQYESVKKLMIDEGYENISLVKDLNGLDRVVSCRKC